MHSIRTPDCERREKVKCRQNLVELALYEYRDFCRWLEEDFVQLQTCNDDDNDFSVAKSD